MWPILFMRLLVQKLIDIEDGIIELLSNPKLTRKKYMIRLMNYDNEKYEFVLTRQEMYDIIGGLSEFLEET